jgi:membrane dipeptidase
VNLEDLLKRSPVLDGHNDLLWALRTAVNYDFEELELTDTSGAERFGTHTDIPRARSGGLGGQFWSVFVPAELPAESIVPATLEQIDAAYRMVARYDDFAFTPDVASVETAWSRGQIASLLGAEGGHQIQNSLGTLRMYAKLGVRYLTLTHNSNVDWADSATDDPRLHGLSDFGREVVSEMNQLGMIVDLSHVSSDVMRQALDVTTKPVMFSHSSARAVCDHPRNVPDDILSALPSNGGLCMVTFVPFFVSPAVREWELDSHEVARSQGIDAENFAEFHAFLDEHARTNPPPACDLQDVVKHVNHVREVAGIDHVGLGGDYDGVGWQPSGLEDVSGYPRLLRALAESGWNNSELEALTCRNVLRVLDANRIPEQ